MVFILLSIILNTVRSKYNAKLRKNKLTYVPFQIVLALLILGLVFVLAVLIEPGLQRDNDGGTSALDMIAIEVTCFCMQTLVLVISLYTELLSQLIIYQDEMGPSQVLVKRDEHF